MISSIPKSVLLWTFRDFVTLTSKFTNVFVYFLYSLILKICANLRPMIIHDADLQIVLSDGIW